MNARRSSAAVSSAGMVLSGAALPVGPAFVQVVAARTLDLPSQAAVALALSVGAFLSGVVCAVFAEARLADPDVPREHRTTGSRLGAVAATTATVLVLVAPTTHSVMVALPVLMAALQIGRMNAVVRGHWRSELIGAVLLVAAGVIASVLTPSIGARAFGFLAVGMVVPVVLRCIVDPAVRPWAVPMRRRVVVGAETCLVAAVPLVLTAVVFTVLGSAAAVAFRLVLTVLGVLQPVLGYLRTVLLARPAPRLVVTLSAMSIGALAAVVAAHLLGVPHQVFGSSWGVSTSAVVAACLWKAASIPATVPFAQLRREGAVLDVMALRAAVAVGAVLGSVLAVELGLGLVGVFTVLASSEILAFVLFSAKAGRSCGRRPSRAAQPAGDRP
ncbi:hypothetical protein DEJ25_12015 [Curtobacterium sp. MCPF17_011]|uniref:hypothetical protein n=1 Tax=Curtobacterium sp. MCPF17_011 TaxID=2175652 RepID=UPI000DA947B0|nr:hypothetical protein [Curtobacterium sp. MCPF17_011]PZF11097.1 hypothetical protein DEJ25_12015 [Curtobacterium sp. MCPF17_011]